MQVLHFSNGGFVAHKIYIGDSRCVFSAWFDKDGVLIDAERIDNRRRSLPATEKQKAELQRVIRAWRIKAPQVNA